MHGRVQWVVALKPEADPVIRRFGLRSLASRSRLFPVYESEDGSVRLVVSGLGKVNAAAATAWLAGVGEERGAAAEAWINFGVAGCGSPDMGRVFLGSRIRDGAAGRSWYPASPWPGTIDPPRREIRTVDAPVTDYGDASCLFEMEAAGFYPVALRSSTIELCQVIKVVSDDPENPVGEVTPGSVRSICERALEDIEPWWNGFLGIVREEAERLSDPDGFGEWLSAGHFTATQRGRLRRLLQERQALDPSGSAAPPDPGATGGKGAILLAALEGSLADLRKSANSPGEEPGSS